LWVTVFDHRYQLPSTGPPQCQLATAVAIGDRVYQTLVDRVRERLGLVRVRTCRHRPLPYGGSHILEGVAVEGFPSKQLITIAMLGVHGSTP
jgi:hypothetical protein